MHKSKSTLSHKHTHIHTRARKTMCSMCLYKNLKFLFFSIRWERKIRPQTAITPFNQHFACSIIVSKLPHKNVWRENKNYAWKINFFTLHLHSARAGDACSMLVFHPAPLWNITQVTNLNKHSKLCSYMLQERQHQHSKYAFAYQYLCLYVREIKSAGKTN